MVPTSSSATGDIPERMTDVIDRALAAVGDVLATTPHVMFCIKSVDSTYLAANQAFADRAGVAAVGDVVGKSAADLFPAGLVIVSQADGRRVTGRVPLSAPLTRDAARPCQFSSAQFSSVLRLRGQVRRRVRTGTRRR